MLYVFEDASDFMAILFLRMHVLFVIDHLFRLFIKLIECVSDLFIFSAYATRMFHFPKKTDLPDSCICVAHYQKLLIFISINKCI